MSSIKNSIGSSFTAPQRSGLAVAAAAFTLAAIGMQAWIDPLRRQPAIEPPNGTKVLGGVGKTGAALPFEYMLGALTGFRQVIAGILWVRADTFFHEGNYDAILPCIRLITWLDPNWIDPYATGAWHLMYNFTDTDQRSDRRYIPGGLALLKEGIANNPTVYDIYKEMAWDNYDKIKDYETAAHYSELGMKNDPNFDVTQVEHMLAHCYERSGRIDKAIAIWEDVAKRHQAAMDDPKSAPDVKGRNKSGLDDALKQMFLDKVRLYHRPIQSQPPIDIQFSAKVERTSSKVLEISGVWNLVGAHLYDAGPLKSGELTLNRVLHMTDYGKGILTQGAVDGARIGVRLQDAGYVQPVTDEFNFDLDPTVTIMQEVISTHGGKSVAPGSIYHWYGAKTAFSDASDDTVGIYGLDHTAGANPGLPLDKALAGGATLSDGGVQQLAALAGEPLAQLKADPAKIAELTGKGYSVAKTSYQVLGTFKRSIDMSKDPKMYSFAKDKYDLILTVNPRDAPEFVQDRSSWTGEGWTDKRYLAVVKPDGGESPPYRVVRQQVELTRDEIVGSGDKVLFDDSPSH